MRRIPKNIRLFLVFVFLLAGLLLVHFRFTQSVPLEESDQMKQATSLARDWFGIIKREKELRGIRSDAGSQVPNHFMIGNDFTFITTTLGSLNSKEISTNPDFAALVVRLVGEAGLSNGGTAGLIISGSFPALAVSTLAALQTMGMEVIMMSSPGASAYGANQPEATWLDMENWLIRKGGLQYRSVLVSFGAENDRGEGLRENGTEIIRNSAERNGYVLYMPGNLPESIRERTNIFVQNNIGILINIGGSQVAVGGCAHASTLPNGLVRNLRLCNHPDRGLIQEAIARGIPVINLLDIRDLASNFGIDPAPGQRYADSKNLYSLNSTNKQALAVTLCSGLIVLLVLLRDLKE